MANLFSRIGSAVSSLVDRTFGTGSPAPVPEPELEDLYGPPIAGEEDPEEECADVEEAKPRNVKRVPQGYPVRIPDEPVCIYGPPPAR